MRIGTLFSDMALDNMVSQVEPLGYSPGYLPSLRRSPCHRIHGAYENDGTQLLCVTGISLYTEISTMRCAGHRDYRPYLELSRVSIRYNYYSGKAHFTYQELHEVAEEVLACIETAPKPGVTDAEKFELSSMIEETGFSIWDDLTHGYKGGYLAPLLGFNSRPAGPIPDLTIEENRTLVVQPKIIIKDGKVGVQTGGLVWVTANGSDRLQRYPGGLIRV